jgi:hypothetical protein
LNQEAAAQEIGIRPDRIALVTSEMNQFMERHGDVHFKETFDTTNTSAWQIYPFDACQSNMFTLKAAQGAGQIDLHPQPDCPNKRISLSPLDAAVPFTDVKVSVDILAWQHYPMWAFYFRRDVATGSYGYVGGVSVITGRAPGKSSLWFHEINREFKADIEVAAIDRVDPTKDYRLILWVVGSEFLLQLFELENLEEPVGTLLVSDSTFTHGTTGLYLFYDENTTNITIDNFSFIGRSGTITSND